MAKITKPIILDETGKEAVDAMKLIAQRIAESGKSFYYELRLQIETGSIARATIGAKVVEAVAVNAEAVLYLDQFGTWIVTAETPGGKKMVTELINAEAPGIHYLTARFQGIYGANWNGTATQAWTRTDDSAVLGEPVPYVAGMEEGDYGSPYDEIMPWAGMHLVEDEAAGMLVSIPKFWFKREVNADNSIDLKIAGYPAPGFSVSPAHMNRGDGKGEREVVYVGAQHCGPSYKSESGVLPMVSRTRAQFRSGIHGLGSDIWQMDVAMRETIKMLYLVEFAHWNSQEKIGYGCGNGSSAENTGAADTMPYHTGTMQTAKTTYGVGVRYRYIEGLWDNVLDWHDGVYFSGTDVYAILNPANYSDTTGGTLVGTRPNSPSYISAYKKMDQPFDWMLYASAAGGSGSSYIGDYCSYAGSGVVLDCGGNWNNRNANCGLFYDFGDGGAGYANSSIGSRLLKLP